MSHSYAQLATSINDAFARWDRSRLHEFELADGTRIGTPDPDTDEDDVLDETRVYLSRLQTSQQFIYVFDLGDDWTHLCTVVEAGIYPQDVLGIVPNTPLPYFGWGNIPDQYGRTSAEENAEASSALADRPAPRPRGARGQVTI
jgi:hypothetical protein